MLLSVALQLPDGANAILVGKLSNGAEPLAFVGGNCSIQGIDSKGQDQLWTVRLRCAPTVG